jgi:hypothetical protein
MANTTQYNTAEYISLHYVFEEEQEGRMNGSKINVY